MKNSSTNQIKISKTQLTSMQWPLSDLFPQGEWWDLQEKKQLELLGKNPEWKLGERREERSATLAHKEAGRGLRGDARQALYLSLFIALINLFR